MSASDRMLIGCTLLAMCVVVNGAANATEPVPPAAASTSAAHSLPAFLDERRLADIQEVWDARVVQSGPTRVEAATRDAQQLAKAQATIQTARAAMKRAQQASEDAAVVRRRAEEISRRFSTGAVTTTPAAASGAQIAIVATVQPVADAAAPAPPQIEHAAAVRAPPVDADTGPAKPFGVGGPLPADATESAPSVAAVEANTTAKPIPPTPHRAPKAGAAKAPRSKAKIGSSSKSGGSAKPSVNSKSGSPAKVATNMRPPLAAAKVLSPAPPANADSPPADDNKSSTMSEVFSGFIRAFGWNSQPE